MGMGKIIVELCSAAMLKKVVFVIQSFTRGTRTHKESRFFAIVGPILADNVIKLSPMLSRLSFSLSQLSQVGQVKALLLLASRVSRK
jgi:hypothetical protein